MSGSLPSPSNAFSTHGALPFIPDQIAKADIRPSPSICPDLIAPISNGRLAVFSIGPSGLGLTHGTWCAICSIAGLIRKWAFVPVSDYFHSKSDSAKNVWRRLANTRSSSARPRAGVSSRFWRMDSTLIRCRNRWRSHRCQTTKTFAARSITTNAR